MSQIDRHVHKRYYSALIDLISYLHKTSKKSNKLAVGEQINHSLKIVGDSKINKI